MKARVYAGKSLTLEHLEKTYTQDLSEIAAKIVTKIGRKLIENWSKIDRKLPQRARNLQKFTRRLFESL